MRNVEIGRRTWIGTLASCALAASLSTGCATTYSSAEVDAELIDAVETARLRREQGNTAVATRLLGAVRDIDPNHDLLFVKE